MNGEIQKSSASTNPPSKQTAFVESCVREGWRILDVQMWQSLCKKLATLEEGSELAMMALLGIAEEHGINPVQLCAYARDEGYKSLEEEAIMHLAQMYGFTQTDYEGDDQVPATEVEADDDEESQPKAKAKWRSAKAYEPSQFETEEDGDEF